jgi:DNA ligase 1
MPFEMLTRRSVAALIATLPFVAPPAAAREARERAGLALPLATEATPDIDPQGWLVSEKYDGARGVWDGTTLRFRSGATVAAPRWFIDRLPREPLDGELWLGRGRFEALSAAVRRHEPDDAEWRSMRYMVFELPGGEGDFSARAQRIQAIVRRVGWPQLVAVDQARIDARAALQRRFDEVVRNGGEGLVLHRADAPWAAGRLSGMLKLKPASDADAQVIGHVPGQGRLAGRLGALRVRSDDGHEFLIGSGFDDAQRADPPAIGSTVTYTYRGRTASGVPRFATFLRERTV